jgi:ferredoxin
LIWQSANVGFADNGFQSPSFRRAKASAPMTHVVAEPCFNCKYTDCVVVCPVECFYEGEAMLFIHPEECIDCEACVPECPPQAIFHEDNLPAEWADYKALNAEMSPNCPVITERRDPMGPPIHK